MMSLFATQVQTSQLVRKPSNVITTSIKCYDALKTVPHDGELSCELWFIWNLVGAYGSCSAFQVMLFDFRIISLRDTTLNPYYLSWSCFSLLPSRPQKVIFSIPWPRNLMAWEKLKMSSLPPTTCFEAHAYNVAIGVVQVCFSSMAFEALQVNITCVSLVS